MYINLFCRLIFLPPLCLLPGKGRKNRQTWLIQNLRIYNQDLRKSERYNKYCKMKTDPYAFFRGSNHIYWADFSTDGRLQRFSAKNTKTWLLGDLHAYNFGAFHDAQNRLAYGLNDFDESLIADYQFDLWRMAISLVLIAEHYTQIKYKRQNKIINAFGKAYLKQLRKLQSTGSPPSPLDKNGECKAVKNLFKDLKNSCSRREMLKKWTNEQGDFDFDNPKLRPLDRETAGALTEALENYRKRLTQIDEGTGVPFFEVKSLAKRLLAGTGSLGRTRYYALIEGAGAGWKDDCILDIKQQQKASAYPYLSASDRKRYDTLFNNHEGKRNMAAGHALSGKYDIFQGWLELNGKIFSVRERSFYKEAVSMETLRDASALKQLAKYWGKLLARSHVHASHTVMPSLHRSHFATAVTKVTAGNKKDFLQLLRELAFAYAGQVEKDWLTFLKLLAPQQCD